MPLKNAFRIFRLAGIDVFLHWTWFLVAIIEIQGRRRSYTSPVWNVLEYLALFLIVLTHEFGHALACRQVGGRAERILLWPFGGVAYVNPPQRPGATLWSIAAGPLVNVALAPLLFGAFYAARMSGLNHAMPDVYRFLWYVLWIDVGLLIFNILPIYPLDGGQILRSLLWFVTGRARSLMIATVVGFIGIAGLIALALWERSTWSFLIAGYLLLSCWNGLQSARKLLRIAKLPRRPGFACPSCKTLPPLGAYWRCSRCSQPFDTFETRAVCPSCSAQYPSTTCLDCRESRPLNEWVVGPGSAPQGGFSREVADARSASYGNS
jgi:Zn-dependent protease